MTLLSLLRSTPILILRTSSILKNMSIYKSYNSKTIGTFTEYKMISNTPMLNAKPKIKNDYLSANFQSSKHRNSLIIFYLCWS